MAESKQSQPLSLIDQLPDLAALEAALERKRRNRLSKWFPDTGPFRRELYPKHMEFFAASREHRETLFMAANRVGKTLCGSYATTLHMTGLYPDWWPGRRFTTPVTAWIVNNTAVTCRDINQVALLGELGQTGTGMIPGELITHMKSKPSVPDGIEIIYIKHVSGGQSTGLFKSYDQGRQKFEGTSIHVIWADEEIPEDVYGECLMRTMIVPGTDKGGIIYCTYTPLQGLTPTTVAFLTHSVNKDSLPIKFNAKKEGSDSYGHERGY